MENKVDKKTLLYYKDLVYSRKEYEYYDLYHKGYTLAYGGMFGGVIGIKICDTENKKVLKAFYNHLSLDEKRNYNLALYQLLCSVNNDSIRQLKLELEDYSVVYFLIKNVTSALGDNRHGKLTGNFQKKINKYFYEESNEMEEIKVMLDDHFYIKEQNDISMIHQILILIKNKNTLGLDKMILRIKNKCLKDNIIIKNVEKLKTQNEIESFFNGILFNKLYSSIDIYSVLGTCLDIGMFNSMEKELQNYYLLVELSRCSSYFSVRWKYPLISRFFEHVNKAKELYKNKKLFLDLDSRLRLFLPYTKKRYYKKI